MTMALDDYTPQRITASSTRARLATPLALSFRPFYFDTNSVNDLVSYYTSYTSDKKNFAFIRGWYIIKRFVHLLRGLYKKNEVRYFSVHTEQARLIKSLLYGIL
jgi:hypothetical protein